MMIGNSTYKFSMDGYLHSNLKIAKDVIKKDWDMVFVIDGAEGSGKSVLAMQCGWFCDNSLNIERIVFTPNEFRKAVSDAKPYQAVVYDEAYTGLSSRATMSLINRTLIKMLAEIRQKNLFIFVVMPTYFDLDKYVALWRSRALLHVYTAKHFERGYFSFFNAERKKNLYVKGKKFYRYGVVPDNFHGRFPNYFIVNEKEYRKKKSNALLVREKKAEEEVIMQYAKNRLIINFIEMDEKFKSKCPNYVFAKLLGISEQWLYIKMKQYENGELDA